MIMRRTMAAALTAALLSGAAFAQRYGDERTVLRHELTAPRERGLRPKARMSPIRAMLLKPVDRVNWDEAPFSDVLQWLRTQDTDHGVVNVVVKWRALDLESIDEDSVVTLSMQDTTVAEVLDEVLDQLTDLDPLTYIGIGNRLKISTKSDLERKLYTRIYNIDEIFMKIRNFQNAPEIDLEEQQQNTGGSGGGAGGQVQSIFGQGGGGGGQDDDDEDDEDDEEREQEVMDWIRTTVEPDTWEENGGLGTLAIFNRQLTVRNNLFVHEKLGGALRFDQ